MIFMKRLLSAGEGYALSRPPILLIYLCLVLLLASACGTFRQPETVFQGMPPFEGIYDIGDKLPADFVIGYDPLDTSKIFMLSDFKGKAVILDAWATTCGACISKF